MELSTFFNPARIIVGDPASSKKDAIERLAEVVCREHPQLDRDEVIKRVMDREALTTTTFETGFAVPHARFDTVDDVTVSVLIPAVPFDDKGIPVRMVFLIVTGLKKSELYLNVLAGIAGMCRDQEKIARLAAAATPQDFARTVSSVSEKIKTEIKIRDIMSNDIGSMTQESTVADALDFIVKNQHPYVPICDADNKLIGEVTLFDILTIALPPYTQMLTNLRFLATLEPLEDLLKHEHDITLSKIMHKPTIVLSPDIYIVEALFHFVKNSHRVYFPVAEHDVYTGIISHIDIVNNFLRI